MTTYTLYSNGVLEKDGDYLPIDSFNQDYIDYLAWRALGNSPTPADASIYLQKLVDNKALRRSLKDQYQTAIDRLLNIQNAGTIPFTQAGFNALVSAVEDVAKYERIIMQVLRLLD